MDREMLELTVDKFTFRVPKQLYYSDANVWIKLEGNTARLGLSDFSQQRSGDVAFAEVKPPGTLLKPGDEFAAVETIKVNISLPSPVTGTIVEVNSELQEAPELTGDEVDLNVYEREKTLGLVAAYERRLQEINAAMKAAARGKYGICERCGKTIDPERLKIFPEARLCVNCKNELEKEQRRLRG